MIYASFWNRATARLIDVSLSMLVMHGTWEVARISGIHTMFGVSMMLLLAFCMVAALGIILPVKKGGTPGQLLLRLRVIRKNGAPLSYPYAVLRFVGYCMVPFLMHLAGMFLMHSMAKSHAETAQWETMMLIWYGVDRYALLPLLAWAGASVILMVHSYEKRTLTDMIGGTVVEQRRDGEGAPAGVLQRICAVYLDIVVPGWIVTVLVHLFPPIDGYASLSVYVLLFMLVYHLAAGTWIVWRYGATPGKLLMRTVIVTSTGKKLGLGQIIVRMLVQWPLIWALFFMPFILENLMGVPTVHAGLLLVLILFLPNVLLVWLTRDNRSLADWAARTKVLLK